MLRQARHGCLVMTNLPHPHPQDHRCRLRSLVSASDRTCVKTSKYGFVDVGTMTGIEGKYAVKQHSEWMNVST